MNFNDVQQIFNRAFFMSFCKRKNLIMFTVLALCGLMIVFFRALSIHAGRWVVMSLSFLPIFLCAGLLLSTGILLIRVYHDEVKRKPFRFLDVLANSWEEMINASYFSIPIILCYLVLWIILGVFVLLKELPGVGEFFGVVLAFGPFLINLGSLALGVMNISMLYFVAPVIALNGFNRIKVSQILTKRLKGDVFLNLVLGIISILPLLIIFGLLLLAWILTGSVCYACVDPNYVVLQGFFMMIPFTALLSPAFVFFFNFAAESHVLIQKQISLAKAE